jgi:hypothetical protein
VRYSTEEFIILKFKKIVLVFEFQEVILFVFLKLQKILFFVISRLIPLRPLSRLIRV